MLFYLAEALLKGLRFYSEFYITTTGLIGFLYIHTKKGTTGESLVLKWCCFTLIYALVQLAMVG